MSKIAEDSFIKISYGAMVFIATLAVGAATWMTTTQLTMAENSKNIEEIRVENEELRDIVVRIDKNVVEINAVLKAK
jgi:hypothetical protein